MKYLRSYNESLIEDRVDWYIKIAKIKYSDKTADEIINIIDNGNESLRFNSEEEKELFKSKWDKIHESHDDWKKYEIEGKLRKSLRNKLSLLGKRARRMGEEGTIVIDSFDGQEPEYFIMFKENDLEQLLGLPFEIWDDNKGKFVEDNNDINPFFELTDEEKDFINLKDGFVSSI